MAIPTYDKIASIVLDSSASSVTFDDIPTQDANSNSYKDLVLSAELIGSTSDQYFLRLNSDSGSSYSWVQMGADSGGAFSSATTTTGIRIGYFATTSARDSLQISIFDFSVSDKHKSVLLRTGSNGSTTRAIAGRWANTAAVTSITLTFSAGTFVSGSTFDLYAIAG